MKHDNHLKSSIKILDDYNGNVPLTGFLKNFFRQHKQMGSRDRKQVASLVYNYFRLEHGWKNDDKKERILGGLFLCENESSDLLQYFQSSWNDRIAQPINDKIDFLTQRGLAFILTDIFPWKNLLSDDINHAAFCSSFLQQPNLFIRARKEKLKEIIVLLEQNNIPYSAYNNSCIALPNGTDIEKIIVDKSWYVIQDYASQQTAKYFSPITDYRSPLSIWDCCAGSGGKSILLHDLFPQVQLFASDIRASILNNLHQRFKEAGIKNYEAAVLDLTKDIHQQMKNQLFDAIIFDAPCSGSGTWARTPEQLYFFRPENIAAFHQRQLSIANNIISYLKNNGVLIYITCSVFKNENEEVINELQKKGLQLVEKGLIKGYDMLADSMFAARFVKG